MAEIVPKVPLVPRRREMSCRFASASMVAHFYEQGPRRGLPTVWPVNGGIQQAGGARLAVQEGLEVLDTAAHDLTPFSLSVVMADAIDAAVEMAKGCPLLDQGGRVEVAPALEM